MGNFTEVLTNNQEKNINKISNEEGKKLQTFNNSLTEYNKAKGSTGVLFGDDLPKTIMIVTANKKICRTFKTSFQSYNVSFKISKNLCLFPQNPGNCNQNRYQNRSTQYQKQYSSNHSNKYPKQKKY